MKAIWWIVVLHTTVLTDAIPVLTATEREAIHEAKTKWREDYAGTPIVVTVFQCGDEQPLRSR